VSKRFLFRSGSGVYTTIAVVVAHARHVHVPGNCLLLRRTLTAMEKGGIEDLGRRWRNPRTASRRTPFLYRRCSRSLSLSQVWRPHEGHRKAHGCRDPTPVSTRVNHCCMKPLSPPRKLCVPRRAPHFSTSPPYRFPLQLLQRPSSRYFPAPTTSWPGGVKGCAPQRSLGTPHSSLLPPLEFA